MCTTCGCSETTQVTLTDPDTGLLRLIRRDSARPVGRGADVSRVEPGQESEPGLRYQPRPEQRHLEPAYRRARSHSHDLAHPHDHSHPHDHVHPHDHALTREHTHSPTQPATTIALEQNILAKNQALAERNRSWLADRAILALNLMSSPGSGKTTLLERTIRDLAGSPEITVVEGDQATARDAQRIRATGARVLQINTGTGCHLEADMLARALDELDPQPGSVVMVENVGNLVCPALFDLGERAKVVILSVTEGEDKPIKYPHMFRSSEVLLLNKVDLLPHLRFDIDRCIEYAREVNPDITIFKVSAETGEGMQAWYSWLRGQADAARMSAAVA